MLLHASTSALSWFSDANVRAKLVEELDDYIQLLKDVDAAYDRSFVRLSTCVMCCIHCLNGFHRTLLHFGKRLPAKFRHGLNFRASLCLFSPAALPLSAFGRFLLILRRFCEKHFDRLHFTRVNAQVQQRASATCC